MRILKSEAFEIGLEVEGSDFTLSLLKGNSNLKKVAFCDGSAAASWADGSVTRSVFGTLDSVREWGIKFYSGVGFDMWPVGVEIDGVKHPLSQSFL